MNTSRTSLVALGATLALVGAACGSDDDAETTPVATEDETDSSSSASEPDDAMDDDAMDDEPMDDDAMDDDAMDDDAMDDDAMDETGEMPFGPACGAVPTDGEGSFAGMVDDPAATAASNNPLLSTLVTAVGQAGLVDTLNSDGPFTIFAPTNDAFAAIPADQLAAVRADQDLLTSILTYHVIAGEAGDAATLAANGVASTVNGAALEFGPDGTTVNGVDIVCSNVMTANATVHIIDEVLLPPADEATEDAMEEDAMEDEAMEDESAAMMPTGPLCAAVPEDGEGSFAGMTDDPAAIAASNNPALSTLVAAVTEAGLVDTLNSDGPFTIFAPADPAFAAIPEDQLNAVLADQDLLTQILTLHVVAGERLSSTDLAALDSVTTVEGSEISLAVDGDALVVAGQATVGCADVQTANAVVHIIDAVLLPGADS
ncbi:MAG: fasciclin domain-containing protein [Actinomycetota bacterium]